MGHPEVENRTPFHFTPVFVADEDGRPIVATVVKGTFDVGADGEVRVAEEQVEPCFAGEHHGEPGESSYRLEPETAFFKKSTDLALLGHARPEHSGARVMRVRFRVGPLEQEARVSGERTFQRSLLGNRISKPEPIEEIPLVWERAFGGWDRSAENEKHHDCEPRNPVGMGFRSRKGSKLEDRRLPNIEHPKDHLAALGGRARPVGFGFIGPEWEPRVRHIGTYNEEWEARRAPALPRDFDRRFFNAAAPELVAPDYLRGDEVVEVQGTRAGPTWSFRLPAVQPPRCLVATRTLGDTELLTALDTVIVDSDARTLTLLWRAHTPLRDGPLDVRSFLVRLPGAAPTTDDTLPAEGVHSPS